MTSSVKQSWLVCYWWQNGLTGPAAAAAFLLPEHSLFKNYSIDVLYSQSYSTILCKVAGLFKAIHHCVESLNRADRHEIKIIPGYIVLALLLLLLLSIKVALKFFSIRTIQSLLTSLFSNLEIKFFILFLPSFRILLLLKYKHTRYPTWIQ